MDAKWEEEEKLAQRRRGAEVYELEFICYVLIGKRKRLTLNIEAEEDEETASDLPSFVS